MADFGGFQIKTPQEIAAQQQAQRAAMFSTGDVNQQRFANVEQGLNAVFGTPGMRQAKALQESIKRAQAGTTQNQGEDDLDFEMRRLKSMRDAVADLDPSAAAQINQRLLEIGEAKFQRARLQASDERTSTQFDWAKKDRALDDVTKGQTYVYDPASGTAVGFDLSNPENNEEFLKARSKPNTTIITPAQKWQLDLQNNDNAARLRAALAKADAASAGGGSKVEMQRVENASAGLIDLYAAADRVMSVIDANPDVLTGSSAAAQKLDKVATELGAAGRMASGGKIYDEQGQPTGQSIDDWLKANSILNTRMQGLVVGMAYSLAKANDPSGRISDKDLAAAVTMVGGDNPNPASILANLNDNLTQRGNAIIARINTLDEPVRKGMEKRVNYLNDQQKAMTARMQRYSQGALGPAATGIKPADDIDSIVNKYKVPKQ